jgi:hypothetical protein
MNFPVVTVKTRELPSEHTHVVDLSHADLILILDKKKKYQRNRNLKRIDAIAVAAFSETSGKNFIPNSKEEWRLYNTNRISDHRNKMMDKFERMQEELVPN